MQLVTPITFAFFCVVRTQNARARATRTSSRMSTVFHKITGRHFLRALPASLPAMPYSPRAAYRLPRSPLALHVWLPAVEMPPPPRLRKMRSFSDSSVHTLLNVYKNDKVMIKSPRTLAAIIDDERVPACLYTTLPWIDGDDDVVFIPC